MKFISPLLSDARNKLGGSVASKNRGGNYFRSRVAPVQPRSTAQQQVRSNLATLSGMWKGLTDDQRAAWSALASGITLKDSLGNSYKPSGSQLFVGCNRNLSTVDESVVDDAPVSKPDFEDVTPLVLVGTAGTPGLHVTTGMSAAPTGFVILVEATPQLSAGIAYLGKSAYRVIGHYAATSFASVNILAAYNARFGALVAGARIGVKVSLVEIASGFQSTPASTDSLVGA